MVTRVTALNPSVLTWAREQIGLSLEDAARRASRPVVVLRGWESGESHPTWNQLETLATIYRRPIAVFFFPEPPTEVPVEAEFRSTVALGSDDLDSDTRLAVREGRAWQQSLRELAGPSNPSTRFILRDLRFGSESSVADIASTVRAYIGVSLQEQQRWPNASEAFKGWRRAMEDVGVFVFKRSFSQNSVSGFCLDDTQFPVIVINNSTTHSRQIFTLFHELAHLLYHVSGITYETLTPAESRTTPVEHACNEFAHEFLVPTQTFNWAEVRDSVDLAATIDTISKRYNVSRLVILRKLYDNAEIGTTDYFNLREQFTADYLARRGGESDGGSYYANQATYLGDAYLTLAFEQLHRGRVTLPELSEHLNIKARNLGKLEDFILTRKSG